MTNHGGMAVVIMVCGAAGRDLLFGKLRFFH